MHLTRLWLVVFVLLPAAACVHHSATKDARLVDETISGVNHRVLAKEKDWGKVMAYAVSTGNYAPLHPARIALEELLDSAIIVVTGVGDSVSTVSLRHQELDFLQFQLRNTAMVLAPFEKLRANTPMPKVTECMDRIKEASKKEKLMLGHLRAAQDSFCEKNHIRFARPSADSVGSDNNH